MEDAYFPEYTCFYPIWTSLIDLSDYRVSDVLAKATSLQYVINIGLPNFEY